MISPPPYVRFIDHSNVYFSKRLPIKYHIVANMIFININNLFSTPVSIGLSVLFGNDLRELFFCCAATPLQDSDLKNHHFIHIFRLIIKETKI